MRFDLQSHSTVSDGTQEPEDVVARAAAAGIEVLSLSDHDDVAGVGRAIAAGREHGVKIVPAMELSAIDGAAEDLHILGYDVDWTHPDLVRELRGFREDRNVRGGRMLRALADCGWALARGPVDARAKAGLPVGRPHLAQAVLDHPDNASRLAAEGLSSIGDVIVAYLTPGKPAYRRRTRPTVSDAIRMIHEYDGVAVWAHPFWDIPTDDAVLSLIDKFQARGLDGVEVFYVAHDERQTRLLYSYTRANGLLSTGSADFHGPNHKSFHTFGAFETYGLEPDLGSLV